MRILTGFLVVAFMAGCTGDLVEIGPGAKGDMSGGVGGGGGGGGGGSSGGEMGPTSTAKFIPDIQADIDSKGCSNLSCHGGTVDPPQLKPMVTAQADIDSNYTNFTGHINKSAPDQSDVLKTMLPGGGHGGGTQFMTTSDPIYQRWLGWITAGAPKQ